MRYSYKLSDAIHILAYLEIYKNDDTSSRAIANSVESNPSVIRGLISKLKKAKLLKTHRGAANTQLATSPEKITILDIYNAIVDNHNLLHIDPKTNLNCLVGHNIQKVLSKSYDKIQHAAEMEMNNITLSDIVSQIKNNIEES